MIQRAALDTDPEVPVDNCVPNYELIESVKCLFFYIYIHLCYNALRV